MDNIGGIKSIHYLPQRSVLIEITNNSLIQLEKKDNQEWVTFPPLTHIEMYVSQVREQGYDLYSIKGKIKIPTTHPAAKELEERLNYNRIILLVETANGEWNVYGTVANPLNTSTLKEIGNKASDFSHISITFEGKTHHDSLIFDSPLPTRI